MEINGENIVDINNGLIVEFLNAQQIGLIQFDRSEDDEFTTIRFIHNDGVVCEYLHNPSESYNPSRRRHASAIVLQEETDPSNVRMIQSVQHKGIEVVRLLPMPKHIFNLVFAFQPRR